MATRHDPDRPDTDPGTSPVHHADSTPSSSTRTGVSEDAPTRADRVRAETVSDAADESRPTQATDEPTAPAPVSRGTAATDTPARSQRIETARAERLEAEAVEQKRSAAYELALAKARNTWSTDFGLLLLRVLPAIMFLHGLRKAQGFAAFRDTVAKNSFGAAAPDLFAVLVIAGQLALPIMIALGFLTRLSATLMAIMMIAIWGLIQLPQGFIDGRTGGIIGESALLYAVLAVPLIFTGPGRFSIDHAFFGRRAATRAERKAEKAVA